MRSAYVCVISVHAPAELLPSTESQRRVPGAGSGESRVPAAAIESRPGAGSAESRAQSAEVRGPQLRTPKLRDGERGLDARLCLGGAVLGRSR